MEVFVAAGGTRILNVDQKLVPSIKGYFEKSKTHLAEQVGLFQVLFKICISKFTFGHLLKFE